MKKPRILLLALIFFVSIACYACSNVGFKVTLNANGGLFDNAAPTYTVTTDGKEVLTITQIPKKDGFEFVGWYLDKNCTQPADELLSRPVTSNVTLYAKWGHKIEFETNGGKPIQPLKAAAGEPISAPVAEKTGYVFEGWYKDSGFEEEFAFGAMPDRNVKVYAKWRLYNTGLVFEPIQGKENELQVKLGDCKDADIRIPAEYEGKPVTYIPQYGFYDGEGIVLSLNIPESMYSICIPGAILCQNLESIAVHPDNRHYRSVDGVLYYEGENGAVLVRYPSARPGNFFAVPDTGINVAEIAGGAFAYSINLSMLAIPRSVTVISDELFWENIFPKIIFAEAPSKPEGWAGGCFGGNLVIFGCEMSPERDRVLSFTKTENSFMNSGGYPWYNNFSLANLLFDDRVLEGWYTDAGFAGQRVANLCDVDNGTKLYAKWIGKTDTFILDLVWDKAREHFKLLWGGYDSAYGFEEVKSGSGQKIGLLLCRWESEYPVLAFECSPENYDEVYEYVLKKNQEQRLTTPYIPYPGTNIYVAEDCSVLYIFNKDLRREGDTIFSKDGTVLLRQLYFSNEGYVFEVPQHVKAIGPRAFMQRTVKKVILNNVESIGALAFSAVGLTELELPGSLKRIGDKAFMFNRISGEIDIPASVESIGIAPFFWCESLTAFNVDEGNPYFKSIDGSIYSKDGTVLIEYPAGRSDDLILPDSVVKVAELAIAGTDIVNFHIGKNLSEIEGDQGLTELYYLKSFTVHPENEHFSAIGGHLYSKDGKVLIKYATDAEGPLFVLPDFVERIEKDAFTDCYKVRHLVMGPNIKSNGGSSAYMYTIIALKGTSHDVIWGISVSVVFIEDVNCTLGQDEGVPYVTSFTKTNEFLDYAGNPYRQGYTFAGWYTEYNAETGQYSGQRYESTSSLSWAPEGTYYAKWEKNNGN